jgi:hypothetical protein
MVSLKGEVDIEVLKIDMSLMVNQISFLSQLNE